MALRFVALDLGMVLCDLSRGDFAEQLARASGRTVDDVERAFDARAWHAMEVGDAAPSEFRASVLRGLGVTLDDGAFDACWNRIPTARARGGSG